jgi:hypothetical protein
MNTYIQFSQVIPHLSPAEVAWLMKYVEHRHRGLDIDGNDGDFDDEVYPYFGFKIMDAPKWGQYAWFFSSQTGDISQVAETVQAFLKKFKPTSSFSMTWADYADTLRAGQFDGGAIFVTAEDIKIFHAGEWVREQEREFNGPAEETIDQVTSP